MFEVIKRMVKAGKRNARGAGRKPKLDAEAKQKVMRMRDAGMTQRAIASELGVSLGVVNKACREAKDATPKAGK
jgi:DNA invertase Pin-like site-specific DNA recombinase